MSDECKNLSVLNELQVADKELLKERICELETALKKQNDQLQIEPTHYFSKGIYAREIIVPKGSLLVGKIHKHQNLNIVSKGEITVLSIDGLKRIKAPATFVSSPGVKRVGYAHEDTVWTCIHGTDETDLEKIEDQFIAKTYDDVLELTEQELKLLKGD